MESFFLGISETLGVYFLYPISCELHNEELKLNMNTPEKVIFLIYLVICGIEPATEVVPGGETF